MNTTNHTIGEDAANGATLPAWFDTFLINVCEIPDRNSPEDEPEVIVATLEELKSCALNAIEQCSAANGAMGERAAHCVNTCNFYNKNRPCECPAPQSDAAAWEAIFDRVALELNCLPSSSPDGNEHVFHAIAKLRAASTQATATQPVQTERALTEAQIESLVDEFCCVEAGDLVRSHNVATEEAMRDALKSAQILLASQPASSPAEGGERE